MNGFLHLKRTYPISKYERECDAYKYLIENTTEQQRTDWGIITSKLREFIQPNEKYIYQAGIENGVFKTMGSSFENFALVREFIFGIKDE